MTTRQLRIGRPTRPWVTPASVGLCLAVWFALLCLVPDPRPLSAPASAVGAIRSLTGLSEPASRAVASVALRAVAFGLLGVLTSSVLGGVRLQFALPLGVGLAVVLSALSQWANYEHFPVGPQLMVSLPSAVAGALAGFGLRRSRIALVALVLLVVGLYFWGTSTRVSDDLDTAARLTAQHVLERAGAIRSGDPGFADAVYLALAYAQDNSHGGDPVQANKAAVLALGVIFGDEKVADVAGRDVGPEWQPRLEELRRRVTLRGRGDSPRHFWVSAALVVLTDETRATTVGLAKELKDSTPGGSGFSFADLAANRAGILFALAAIRDAESARATQRLVVSGLSSNDYCPEIKDLPEGLSSEQFQAEYGGLGGQRTREILAAIDQRMATKVVLRDNR